MKEFFGFTEEAPVATEQEKAPVVRSFKGSLLQQSPASKSAIAEIKVEEPRVYEDSLTIASHLREYKPVIINLKYLDSVAGKRLIDFICGTAYAINGHMVKIGENIFLFTPEHIHISETKEKSFDSTFENNDSQDTFLKRAVMS